MTQALRRMAATTRPVARSQGDANADLATALSEEEGENSVEPDHHEQGREETEEAGEPGHHAIAHQMVGNVLLKDRKLHLDAGIFFAQPTPYSQLLGCRIARCNQHHDIGVLCCYRKLRDGHEGLNLHVFSNVGILCVRNNADDLVGSLGILRLRTNVDLNSQWRTCADILADEGVIDD